MTSPTPLTPGSSPRGTTPSFAGSSSRNTTLTATGSPSTTLTPMTSGTSQTPMMPTKLPPIMGKTLGLLAALLLAQLALAAFLFMRGSGFGAVQPDAPLITFDPAVVDRVTIQDGSGAQVELVKRDGQWRLPGHFDFPASASKVEALLKDLQGLRTRLPVSTSPEAFTRFKVAADQFERRIDLRQGDQELAVLYLGDSPGFKRLFARGGQGEAVFEVAYAAHQAGAKANDWTDKGLFALTSDQIAGLTLNGMVLTKTKAGNGSQEDSEDKVSGQGGQDRKGENSGPGGLVSKAEDSDQHGQDPDAEDGGQIRKAEGGGQAGQVGPDRWVLEGETTEIDQVKAGDLVRAAANLNYLEVLGTEAKPAYQMDNPVVRLTVQPREGKPREFLIAKLADSEDYVLKASDHPWYFKVGAWAVKRLEEASKEQLLLAAVSPATSPEPAPESAPIAIELPPAAASAPEAAPTPGDVPAAATPDLPSPAQN